MPAGNFVVRAAIERTGGLTVPRPSGSPSEPGPEEGPGVTGRAWGCEYSEARGGAAAAVSRGRVSRGLQARYGFKWEEAAF